MDFFHSLKLKYGMRWNTGHFKPRWRQVYDLIIVGILMYAAAHIFADFLIKRELTGDLQLAKAKTELREGQITRCLNGKSVGSFYDRATRHYVAVVCRPAEEIDYGKESS